MLPSNAISVNPEEAEYLSPDIDDDSTIQSLESGGIALNDASLGRLVQTWRSWIEEPYIKVSPISGLPETILVSTGNYSFVSIAFDSSMAPALLYIQDGVFKFRWFNTVISQFQTDVYPDISSGRLSTDDKRKSQEGVSDVIFAYIRAGNLYWRQERDRYTVEYFAGAAADRRLGRVGMTENLRMKFELISTL